MFDLDDVLSESDYETSEERNKRLLKIPSGRQKQKARPKRKREREEEIDPTYEPSVQVQRTVVARDVTESSSRKPTFEEKGKAAASVFEIVHTATSPLLTQTQIQAQIPTQLQTSLPETQTQIHDLTQSPSTPLNTETSTEDVILTPFSKMVSEYQVLDSPPIQTTPPPIQTTPPPIHTTPPPTQTAQTQLSPISSILNMYTTLRSEFSEVEEKTADRLEAMEKLVNEQTRLLEAQTKLIITQADTIDSLQQRLNHAESTAEALKTRLDATELEYRKANVDYENVLEELSDLRSLVENQGDKPPMEEDEEEEKDEDETEADIVMKDKEGDDKGDDKDKDQGGATEKPPANDDDTDDGNDGNSGKQTVSTTSGGKTETSSQAGGVQDSQQETESEIPTSEAHSPKWGTVEIIGDDGFIREEPATGKEIVLYVPKVDEPEVEEKTTASEEKQFEETIYGDDVYEEELVDYGTTDSDEAEIFMTEEDIIKPPSTENVENVETTSAPQEHNDDVEGQTTNQEPSTVNTSQPGTSEPEKIDKSDWFKKIPAPIKFPVRSFFVYSKSSEYTGSILAWKYEDQLRMFAIKHREGVQYFKKSFRALNSINIFELGRLSKLNMVNHSRDSAAESMERILRREIYSKNYDIIKPIFGKRRVYKNKVDPKTNKPPLIKYKYPPVNCVKEVPLLKFPQDVLQKDFSHWRYDPPTTELVVELTDKREVLRVFDHNMVINLSKADLEVLNVGRIIYERSNKMDYEQVMKFKDAIKYCVRRNVHSQNHIPTPEV